VEGHWREAEPIANEKTDAVDIGREEERRVRNK
jgi:hypothetical protein